MPANRRKKPTRENEKGGGGESSGEKIRKPSHVVEVGLEGRNEVGRRGALVQPSIVTRPARWLLKFKDPTATAAVAAASKHASGAQFAAPRRGELLFSRHASRNKYRKYTLRNCAIKYSVRNLELFHDKNSTERYPFSRIFNLRY